MKNETLITLIKNLKSDLNILEYKVKFTGIEVNGFKGEAVENSIRKIRDEIKFIEKYFE